MLQIIQEQDQTRISASAKNSRDAIKKVAEMWTMIAKWHMSYGLIKAIAGDTDSYETFYWDKESIQYYDLEFESDNELMQSPAQEYQTTMEFAKMGLFVNPKTGQMDEQARAQLISRLKGFGRWEDITQRTDQQVAKARRNIELVKQGRLEDVRISAIDNNEIAIDEYKGFMLSSEYEKLVKDVPAVGDFMEGLIEWNRSESQRKAKDEIMQQLQTQSDAQMTMELANQQFQNVAARQNATMQDKNAAQAASNMTNVPQPTQPQSPQSVSPDQRMAEMLAQAQ
jgi:hypothetical protein